MQNNTIRNIWFDFKSEVIFGSVLILLTVLSYWLAAYIPEQVFEDYINPIEYIGTSAVCFFRAFLLLTHSEHNRLRMSWAAVLLVWGCVDVVIWAMRYILHIKMIGGTPSDPLFNASVTLGNTLAFMLFIYPTQVLRPGWLNWRRSVLLLLPMLLLGVVDYIVPANLLLLIMVYPVLIFLTLCWHLRKYRQWCEDNFSTLDDIDAQWIVRYLTMLALAGLAFYFIVFWYVPNRMFTQQWLFLLMFTYTTERLLYRPDPWKRLRNTVGEEEEEPNSANANRAKLEAWLEQEKPYCNPDFQLTDLRKVLPLNRTYLSQLINAEYGCSFYQWVNGLRINEAKRLMTEQPEIKIHEVAKLSGFSSPVVFSRVFIRETGIAPSKWGQKSNNS